MELLSIFKSENHRDLLTQLFPGSVALWPFVICVYNTIPNGLITYYDWILITGVIAYLFLSWSVGFVIADLGSIIELRLEYILFKIKSQEMKRISKECTPFSRKDFWTGILRHCVAWLLILIPVSWEFLFGKYVHKRVLKSVDEINDKFYNTWEKYLMLQIPSSSEYVIIKYYRGFLNRLKFELNTVAALTIMSFGQLILLFLFGDLQNIDWINTIVYIVILLVFISFLLIEAFKGIEVLDQLRKKMIKEFGVV